MRSCGVLSNFYTAVDVARILSNGVQDYNCHADLTRWRTAFYGPRGDPPSQTHRDIQKLLAIATGWLGFLGAHGMCPRTRASVAAAARDVFAGPRQALR